MAVIREFLGAEQLLTTPASKPTSPTPSSDPFGPAEPINEVADEARVGGEGVTFMKRTYAIRALLSVCSALTAIFMVGGANAKW
jgi:hypothetical protein